MRRTLIIAATCSLTATSMGDSNLGKVAGVNYAAYDLATGLVTPTAFGPRSSAPIWDPSGGPASNLYYLVTMDCLPAPDPGVIAYDWGDIPNGSLVSGFTLGYATDLSLPMTIDCQIVFYANYDGCNGNGQYPLSGYYFSNLPSAMGAYNAWYIAVDLEPNLTFPIIGNDLDGDGMADFGYSFWFPNLSGLDSATGPFLANPDIDRYGSIAGAEAALGIEDLLVGCGGCESLGGWDPNDPSTAYAQLYIVLFGGYTGCIASPGASGNFCTADIDGDCLVGLSDLAALLANYGATGGGLVGDYDGNGIVNLSDLATLLGQYGDNCN